MSMSCYFVNWGEIRSNKRIEGSGKVLSGISFPFSKPGSFRSLFDNNVNILVEDKGKMEAR